MGNGPLPVKQVPAWIAILICLGLPALFFVAAPVHAMRIGLDIEDFNPPYSTGDPRVAAVLTAYNGENDKEAERLSRQLLARALTRKSDGGLAEVEARFLLARTLDSERRLTEAETEYRQGLTVLAPLVAAPEGRQNRADAKARQWVRYFEILLRYNLEGQGRAREAQLLPSLLPANGSAAANSQTERGVAWLPGIALSPCPGQWPVIRPLTDSESKDRKQWDDDAAERLAAGKAGEAEPLLLRMLALDQRSFGPAHCETAVDHRRIAQALLDQNRLSEAEEQARRALAIFDQIHEDNRQTIHALGILADILGKGRGPSEAEPYLRRALVLIERRRGTDSEDAASARLTLAANLFAQYKLAESEALYRQALAGLRGYYPGGQALALDVQEFTGYLAGLQGKTAEAISDYRLICPRRAELIAQEGRGAAASLLDNKTHAQAGNCALQQVTALRQWAEAGGGEAEADRPDALRAEAFEQAQLALPSPSGDTLARAGARIAAAMTGAGALAERYEAAIHERDSMGYAPVPFWRDRSQEMSEQDAATRKTRDTLDQQIAEIASQLAQQAPRYWDMRVPRPLSMAALMAHKGPDNILLRKDEALLFFMVPPGDRHGLVFAVSRDRAGWSRIDLTGDALKKAVVTLRAGIDSRAYGLPPELRTNDSTYEPFDRALAYRLYQALFGSPAIQTVIADRKTLIIVPTGPLTTLPPGLLVTQPPEGGPAADENPQSLRKTAWLLRSKAIALLPSVASLRTIRQLTPVPRQAAPVPLLAFTNPDFAGRAATAATDMPSPPAMRRAPDGFLSYFRGGEPVKEALRKLPPLPRTWDEGMALATALGAPRSAVLAGAAASKAELMKRNADGRLIDVRVLEFATHGLVAGDGDGLAEPALALAAGNSASDWLLTASEAATLRLNAEWVLLSACNTASPDLKDPDGLSGLVRAFFYAGTPDLLVSHWTIGDDTAAKIVPATIRLNEGRSRLSKAEALRRASLAILDDASSDQTHPVYWAPFTLIGDPH